MKITDAKVFLGGPGKNYVTLKIMTDAGVASYIVTTTITYHTHIH